MMYAEKKRVEYVARTGASFQGQRDLPLNNPVKKIYDRLVAELMPETTKLLAQEHQRKEAHM